VRNELAGLFRTELESARATLQEALDTTVRDSVAELRVELAAARTREQRAELEHRAELTALLRRLTDVLDDVGARIDAERADRSELLRALEFLMREVILSASPTTAPASVTGGTVEPGPGRAIAPDRELIDLTEARIEPGSLVEVRSRYDDRWVHGFEVIEIVAGADGERYRLTRRHDRQPLPTLFDAGDVRLAPSASPLLAPEE
jgi:hypothetical protein